MYVCVYINTCMYFCETFLISNGAWKIAWPTVPSWKSWPSVPVEDCKCITPFFPEALPGSITAASQSPSCSPHPCVPHHTQTHSHLRREAKLTLKPCLVWTVDHCLFSNRSRRPRWPRWKSMRPESTTGPQLPEPLCSTSSWATSARSTQCTGFLSRWFLHLELFA